MDIIYIAYRKGKVFAYSNDPDEFIIYLRNFYSKNNKATLKICKKKMGDMELHKMQIEYPEFEIIEYHDGIYLTGFEAEYMDKYLRGFYYVANDLYKKNNLKPYGSYEEFLLCLGRDGIEKATEGFDYDIALNDYKLTREFLAINKDK